MRGAQTLSFVEEVEGVVEESSSLRDKEAEPQGGERYL